MERDTPPNLALGPYRLLHRLETTKSSTVWVATRPTAGGMEGLFAVKVVGHETPANRAVRETLLARASLSAKLESPFVVRTVDWGAENGFLYSVMDWVRGCRLRTLQAFAPDHCIPFPIATFLGIQAASGLHDAHTFRGKGESRSFGFTHGKISPDHLLVSTEGVAKLLSFGAVEETDVLPEALQNRDRPLPPELARQMALDRQEDVLTLAWIIYEAMTGSAQMRSTSGTFRAVTAGTAAARARAPHVPPGLHAIFERALAPNSDDRFPSAEAFRMALESWLADSGAAPSQALVAGWVRQVASSEIGALDAVLRTALGKEPNGREPWSDPEVPAVTPALDLETPTPRAPKPRSPDSVTQVSPLGKGTVPGKPVDIVIRQKTVPGNEISAYLVPVSAPIQTAEAAPLAPSNLQVDLPPDVLPRVKYDEVHRPPKERNRVSPRLRRVALWVGMGLGLWLGVGVLYGALTFYTHRHGPLWPVASGKETVQVIAPSDDPSKTSAMSAEAIETQAASVKVKGTSKELGRFLPAFTACQKEARKRMPTTNGTVTFSVLVNSNGTVGKVTSESSDEIDIPFRKCLENAVRQKPFLASGSTRIFSFTATFERSATP